MKRGGRLPQRRATPRRKVHPLQPPETNTGPGLASSGPDSSMVPPNAPERRYGGLPQQRATPRRERHPVRPAGEIEPDIAPVVPDDFARRVLDATSPRGRCAGTPGCPPGPHEGRHAHHIHPRGRGGSDHTLNGAWLCPTGHAWAHAHPNDTHERHPSHPDGPGAVVSPGAVTLGLTASSSLPWPEPPDQLGT